MPLKTTHVYKTVDDCEIRADVHTKPGSEPRPVIVWLHGGALMLGNRGAIEPAQVDRYLDAGYTVVAVDYRLAPETKLPEILRDVQDAIAWVRTEGPRLFHIDPARLAVIGHSAGGYLTLLAGCYAHPRPQVLVAFYGYGDIAGAWYSTPSPFYCQQPPVSEAEARAVVGTTPLSRSPREEFKDGDADDARGRFYLYCRQRGTWPQEATGFDPATHAETLAPFCPERHVGADYPPTLLLHGDNDTDVPYDQSVRMADALAAASVPYRLLTIPHGEHGFDWRMEDSTVTAAFQEVLAFLAHYLGPIDSGQAAW